jgi:methionyl-tRNA formyltransferase
MPLRIVFMGTPDFSVATLAGLIAAGHRIVAVYSQPPRPAGRGMGERKSPVHLHADSAGIPVHTPKSLRTTEAVETYLAHRADVAVVVAYGLILPQPILDAPRLGCLNLHASALPRWRGAAPIQRAVMAGDRETAVMVMRMEAGLDTGPVYLAEHVPIGDEMTAGELHDALARRGAGLMVRALADLERGNLVATPQAAEGITYARKIEKSEAHIDFARPAAEVHAQIRGLSPFPGAWFEVGPPGKVERIKVLRAKLVHSSATDRTPGKIIDDDLTIACAVGAIRLVELQRAGKKPMPAEELLRGFPMPTGILLR